MTDLQRFHVTEQPLTTLIHIAQAKNPARKPRGLWYAFDHQWQSLLCTGKIAGKKPGRHQYSITLASNARLCVLSKVNDVVAFTKAYGRALPWALSGAPEDKCIDWAEVAKDFQGIELRTLSRDGRRYMDWVDIDWAIPSGCIWDPESAQVLTADG